MSTATITLQSTRSGDPVFPARRSVLFLLPSLQGGGAERVMVTILRHLDRARFDVTLAVLDGRDPAYLEELPPDVTFIDLNCRRARYAAAAVFRLIRQRRPDVVFSVIGHLNLLVALLKPVLPRRTRFIARETTTVSELVSGQPGERLIRFIYGRLYRRFDRIVCQSSDMRMDLVDRLGVPHEKTIVLSNPVDLVRVARLAAEPVTLIPWASECDHTISLVAAGRLANEKGFDLLIDAVALCADSRLRLTILGEGPLRHALQSRAETRGIGAHVRLVGFQSNPYAFFRRADAFVLSSRFEGVPNVVLEALACGTPVIATPASGGILELLEGRPGCIIAAAISAEGLAAAITCFLSRGGRNALEPELEDFAVAHVCGQYEALFADPRPNGGG